MELLFSFLNIQNGIMKATWNLGIKHDNDIICTYAKI